jgi:hypothetical protein
MIGTINVLEENLALPSGHPTNLDSAGSFHFVLRKSLGLSAPSKQFLSRTKRTIKERVGDKPRLAGLILVQSRARTCD